MVRGRAVCRGGGYRTTVEVYVCVAVKVRAAATEEGRARGTEKGNLQMWLYLQISCQKSHLERTGQIPAQ